MAENEQTDLTALTVQLLSAYVANNSVPSAELAELIETTRKALAGKVGEAATPAAEYVPAVTVRKSLGSRDHILSMIDGKPYKSLKRHLSTKGITPAEYRERYNLPKDYPMVAPNYSDQRREVAKRLGLGRRFSGGAVATYEAAPDVAAATLPQAPSVEAVTTPAKRVTKPREQAPKATSGPIAMESAAEVPAEAPAPEAPVESAPAPLKKEGKPRQKAIAATSAKAPKTPGAARATAPKATSAQVPRKPRAAKAAEAPREMGGDAPAAAPAKRVRKPR